MSEAETIVMREAPSSLKQMARAVKSSSSKKGKGDLPSLIMRRDNVKLDKAHIAAYKQVCGYEKQAPVPITYLHMLAHPLFMEMMTHEKFPFPVIGMVHVNNTITKLRNINEGESVNVQCSFAPLADHDKGKVITLITEVFSNDELVWKEESSNLRRMKTSETPKEKAPTPRRRPLNNHAEPWLLPNNLGRRYGKVSGDRNPIHLWPTTAKAFGFKRHIAHGMWSKARACASLEAIMGDVPSKVDVEFKLPIFLPSKVHFYHQENGNGRDFELWDKQGAKPHLRGRIETL